VLVDWLQSQPNTDLYRVKVAPDMVALQENYIKTNQIPPGMEYAENYEKFYVEPANVGTDLLRKP
jgi:hypothetical protein